MMRVLPSVNCHYGDTEAVAAKLAQIAKLDGAVAHFDVADGIFTFNKSWNEPERLRELAPGAPFEAHLMVENPRPVVERWLAAGARRIAVHMEAVTPALFAELAVTIREAGAEPVLALNPETPPENVAAYFHATASFLVLSVHPGLSGQKFLPRALEAVAFLRRVVPKADIEVDGGITAETARAAARAGADAVVSDSYLFRSADLRRTFEELRAAG